MESVSGITVFFVVSLRYRLADPSTRSLCALLIARLCDGSRPYIMQWLAAEAALASTFDDQAITRLPASQ